MSEESMHAMLDMAHPDTRFLFNLPVSELNEVAPIYERLRARCPRVGTTNGHE
jgi:hypothetical protein